MVTQIPYLIIANQLKTTHCDTSALFCPFGLCSGPSLFVWFVTWGNKIGCDGNRARQQACVEARSLLHLMFLCFLRSLVIESVLPLSPIMFPCAPLIAFSFFPFPISCPFLFLPLSSFTLPFASSAFPVNCFFFAPPTHFSASQSFPSFGFSVFSDFLFNRLWLFYFYHFLLLSPLTYFSAFTLFMPLSPLSLAPSRPVL